MIAIRKGVSPAPEPVVKVCGLDTELANFIVGRRDGLATPGEAARRVLAEIHGYPGRDGPPVRTGVERGDGKEEAASSSSPPSSSPPSSSSGPSPASSSAGSPSGSSGYDPQDWGRRFLAENGGSAYIDMDHLELCPPETADPFEAVALWRAMLRIARQALPKANEKLPRGERLVLCASNTDGRGHSFGGHLSVLLTRRAFDDIFYRKPHHLLFLASYLATGVLFGAGKVGSENGSPPADYQLSQRADFFTSLVGVQTTHDRPIVNARDEALAGPDRYARLHVIPFDSTLCQVATLLKVGVTQIIVSMLEQGEVHGDCLLDDPIEAMAAWSHDPTLCRRAKLLTGAQATVVDLQRRFFDRAARFVERGAAREVVPLAAQVLEVWEETLVRLERRDLVSLAGDLDWALKLSLLDGVRRRRGLGWSSPELRRLDLAYSSLEDGLFWACERAGRVRRVVRDAEIDRLTREPPDETRAFARAHLLRRARGRVERCDWESITLRTRRERWGDATRRLELSEPTGFSRRRCERMFRRTRNLDALIDGLQALENGAVPGEAGGGSPEDRSSPTPSPPRTPSRPSFQKERTHEVP